MSDTKTPGEKIIERLAAYEKALREIATSKHCRYEENGPDLYGIGVTDGHRYCAEVASKALGGTNRSNDSSKVGN